MTHLLEKLFSVSMMSYFTPQNRATLGSVPPEQLKGTEESQPVREKLHHLHSALLPHIHNASLALHLYRARPRSDVSFKPTVSVHEAQAASLIYYRGETQATVIERLMGRELAGSDLKLEARRHPAIEIRLTPTHYTVELVLSPDAWWDQRNLLGKLTVKRHRDTFFEHLRKLDGQTCLGFWGGIQLSDMHLKVEKITRVEILADWMDTFAVGKDWFRLGRWYEPDDPALAEARIVDETMRQVRALYPLYEHLLWSSDNNFHSFYHKYHHPTHII